MKLQIRTNLVAWIILIVLVIVWGSSFILMKKGLIYFSSEIVGALRMSIAFIVLLPLSLKALSILTKTQWIYLFLAGIFANALPAFLFSYAQTGINSSLAGILNSLTPLSTMLIALLFFHFKLTWQKVLGVLLGTTGVIGLLSISGGHSFEFNFHYAKFIIMATICYAISLNLIKYKLKELDASVITSVSLLLVGIPITAYLFIFTDFLAQINNNSLALRGVGYIALLAVFGTSLALIAFNRLIKISNVVFAASVTYMIPIVAIMWGILDGEKFSMFTIFWICIIISGVVLVRNREENR
ncbi:DMT family transporter [Bacteroidota bacterium]